jgi:hypothetical protein
MPPAQLNAMSALPAASSAAPSTEPPDRSEKYSYIPSNTGQSDSPGAPMLKRLSCCMKSCEWLGVAARMKEM